LAVNKPRALIDCGHIFFLTRTGSKFKIEAVSSQSKADKNSPLLQLIARQMKYKAKAGPLLQPLAFQFDMKDDGEDYPFTHALYAPFSPDPARGGLLLTRNRPWEDSEQIIPSRSSRRRWMG